MDWYYTTPSDEQVGPVDESTIQGLIASRTITESTPVWNESLPEWVEAKSTSLADLFPATKPPPQRSKKVAESASTAQPADSFARDENFVYPTNPPRSPHQAWLNIMGPGIAQVVFGKSMLGLAVLAVATFLEISSNFMVFIAAANMDEPPGIYYFFQLLLLGLFIASMVDAYMTGNRLREGQPVGKWQVFPLRTPL